MEALGGVDQKALSLQHRQLSSLRGSLESFPLADVLTLLASTGNTGALEVTGRGGEGCLFVDDGDVVAATAGAIDSPVEVVVELLRLEDGAFSFEPDELAERPGPPVAVPGLLAAARARLDEWFAIEAVLPTVEHEVFLAAKAPADEVVVSAEQWRALAAIGGGGPIGLILDRISEDDLAARRLLKGLVEAGLLDVVAPLREREPPELQWQPGEREPVAVPPVIIVRAEPVPRILDPALEARLDALAEQFDVVYEVAQAAADEDAECAGPSSGLFAKLLHRHER